MSDSRGKCRCRRIAPRFKRRRKPRRRSRRMPEPNSGDRCSRGCRLVRFLDRKIAARLPTRYPRRVEWRMIPDYRDFTIGSMFKGTDQSPARSALLTANWRGCEPLGRADPRCSGMIALDQQAETTMIDLEVPVEGVALDARDAFLSSDRSPPDG